MPVVWVANEAGHPYHKVEKLLPGAEIKFLTLEKTNPLEVDRLHWHIARGIARYCNPGEYLLIAGSPMICAACYALWLLHFGECNLIQWNASKREYEMKYVERDNLSRILDEHLTR